MKNKEKVKVQSFGEFMKGILKFSVKAFFLGFVFISVLLLSSYFVKGLSNATIAYNFSEGSGNFIDYFNKYNFTPSGTWAYNRSGIIGNGVYSNDGYASSTIGEIQTGDFSFEIWVKPNSTTDQILVGSDTGNWGGIRINPVANSIDYEVDGIGAYRFNNAAYVTNGVWHQYAIVRSGNEYSFYHNGTLLNRSVQTGNFHSGALRLGYASSLGIVGDVDEFRIWDNIVLSDANILELYNNGAALSYPFPISTIVDYTPVFVSQTPSDLTVINGFSTNITYNFSDPNKNLSSIMLNVSFFNNTDVINGTYYNSFQIPYTTNNTDLFNWYLDDGDVYPGVYNVNHSIMSNTPHSNYTLSTLNDAIKVQLIGINTTKAYNILEVMVQNDDISNIIYCNSSYITGNPLTNSNCAIVSSSLLTRYNHTHNYSSHNIFSLPIFNNTFSGITITSTSYFIVAKNINGTTYVGYINGSPRTNSTMVTGNRGTTWTNVNYTADLHVHQYNTNDAIVYQACYKNTTSSVYVCSTARNDTYEQIPLPPTSSNTFFLPSSTIVFKKNNVTVWNGLSYAVNGYINNYSKRLLNDYYSIITTFNITNTSQGYEYDFNDSLGGGWYLFNTRATDNNSLSSDGYSDLFFLSTDYYTPCNTTYTLNSTGITVTINYTNDNNLSNLYGNYSYLYKIFTNGENSINNSTIQGNYRLYFNYSGYYVDTGCYIGFCLNDWVRSTQPCTDNLRLITYTDTNYCANSYDVPSVNGTYEDCTTAPNTDQDLWLLIILILLWAFSIFISFRFPIVLILSVLLSVVITYCMINYFTMANFSGIVNFIFPIATFFIGAGVVAYAKLK